MKRMAFHHPGGLNHGDKLSLQSARQPFVLSFLSILLLFAPVFALKAQKLDVPYASTPPEVVEKMLDMAHVGPGDYVIDLGSGDGRIVIAAARRGAYGHGVDLDPERIEESEENARRAGVSDRVIFLQENIFETDISRANVVTLYLLSTINEDLRPRLLKELNPGTRVVSHNFGMGPWEPDKHITLGDSYMDKDQLTIEERLDKVDHEIYYWVVPASIEGRWQWQTKGKTFIMEVEQHHQKFYTRLTSGSDTLSIDHKKLTGRQISFTATNPEKETHYAFSGIIKGDHITGTIQIRYQNSGMINHWNANKTDQ